MYSLMFFLRWTAMQRKALINVFAILSGLFMLSANAQVIEFNSSGGSNATNGLHFYIDNTTHIQVRRLNNTGQVYAPGSVPVSTSLDNGVFIWGNGKLYGPSHAVGGTFNPTGGMFNTSSILATTPANPSSAGVQQTAAASVGITNGPQVQIVWKYTTPLDFMTAEVQVTIPVGYAVSAANPVRYYHVFDTYLGGSDQGCGIDIPGTTRIVGTYSGQASGPACPTSNSLPGSGVVESFRERSGTFSHYCVGFWSDFYSNAGSNCYLQRAGGLVNSVTTTLQDTGMAIEYDFTAPGVYIFSYDFVIGSTTVPAYDHIEIRHDGSATLCPDTIKVLACTSSTVPCPALNIVNTGTLTGNLTLTPTAAGATFTPSTFTIGSAGNIADVILQATAASAGTFALSATGLSQAPLNGTKCADLNGTATSTCNITITNTPCVANFECLETGLTYNNPVTVLNRNPLYTKLVNTGFKFDVVAMQSSGAVANTYTGTVNVELYDDSASPICTAATALAGPTQSLTFALGDSGRKTLTANVTLANAYKKLRCRVKETTATSPVTACSSDSFTVRPTSISAISSTANADNSGQSIISTPVVKAGSAFTITADTGVVGYNGTPEINSGLLEWIVNTSPTATNMTVGGLTGLFGSANAATGNGATGASFKYGEVGYFRFKTAGVFDKTFVNSSSDDSNGDCINTAPNDFSNALIGAVGGVGGKYGCKFGNVAASNYFGRFVPDHFTIASMTFTPGCGTEATPFTYMDQPFGSLTASIEARSASNTVTTNYMNTPLIPATSFARGTVVQELENANNGVAITPARMVSSGTWVAGVFPYVASKFTSLPTPDGPYDTLVAGLGVSDLDAILLTDRDMQASSTSCTADSTGLSNGTCTAKTIATMKMRLGRIRLSNAFGSEKLALPVPMKLEYYGGTATDWIPNTLDTTCTVPAPKNFGFAFPAGTTAKPNNLVACETAVSTPPLKLSAPGVGNNGWTDMVLVLDTIPAGYTQCVAVGAAGSAPVSMNMPWLQFPWKGIAKTDPTAKASFGVYKKANEFIYIREVH